VVIAKALLVGVHVEEENRTYSFYADTPKQEKRVLADMLDFLKSKPKLNLLSYSGCRVEQRMLDQRLAAYRLPRDVAESVRDIYFDIHACAAFPTQQLTLKEVAKYCGFEWRDSGMDGFAAAVLYGSGKLTKARKRLLIRYNEDDLLALKCVVRHLDTLCVNAQGELKFQ
jgi:predicted RecB family nuclease